jgi:hypothetical protein
MAHDASSPSRCANFGAAAGARLRVPGLPENIAGKISLGEDDWNGRGSCWEWTEALTNGYGVVQHEGRVQRAHRVVFSLLQEPVPDNLEIDHLCRNRRCVNPDHIVVALLRLNWPARAPGKHPDRYELIRKFTPDVYVLPNRPSFSNGGTDATEYAWMVWNRSARWRPGRIQILDTTAKKDRKGQR